MKGLLSSPLTAFPALPPRQSMLFVLTLVFLLNALVIYTMLGVPRLGISLQSVDGKIVLQEDDEAVPAEPLERRELVAAGMSGSSILLEGSDLLEEPDLFTHYAQYNRFMQRQSILFELLQQPQIELHWADQTSTTILPRQTRPGDLPLMFWLQLTVASISLIVGTSVWLFRRQDRSALHYFQIGVYLALVIFPAAIYSSRELALDGELFRLLSIFDHLGLYLVMAAMVSLIWCFPLPLWSFPFPTFMYVLMSLCWIADTLQWFPGLDVSTRIIPLLMLLLGVLLLLVHWKRSRGKALYRQSIKWFLLVILAGSGLFVGVVFVPPLLGFSPLISQGLAFVAFLSIYLSLAIGVVRYQLFELDRWWFKVWVWVAVGIILMGFDILFISLLDLSEDQSLWLALGVTGWLYFPLRQYLLTRFMSYKNGSLESYLPMIVRSIAQAGGAQELVTANRDCLLTIFSPLTSGMREELEPATAVFEQGLSMHVPFPRVNQTLAMKCPGQGRELFQGRDVEIVQAIMNLFEQAFIAREVRDDAIRQERERIKQDMHDTLGGRLLSIMRQEAEPVSAQIATSAWRELRDILTALESKKAPLMPVLVQWHRDARQQMEKTSVALEWVIDTELRDTGWVIDGNQRLNLGQILRESLTNALRHSTATLVKVHFSVEKNNLMLLVNNNGVQLAPEEWVAGRGLHHIRQRAQKLGAKIDWSQLVNGSVELSLKLPMMKESDG